MKYLRLKNNNIYKIVSEAKEEFAKNYGVAMLVEDNEGKKFYLGEDQLEGSKRADTIEELIQLNDIVFYWQPSDDKVHSTLMSYSREIDGMQYNAIFKLLVPVGDDYKCVAKAEPKFAVFGGRMSLVQKGVLELL